MGPAGITNYVVLLVPFESGKFPGQGRVDLFEMMAELSGTQIRPAVENYHKLQHGR